MKLLPYNLMKNYEHFDARYHAELPLANIRALREERLKLCEQDNLQIYWDALEQAPKLKNLKTTFDQAMVSADASAPVDKDLQHKLEKSLRTFCPWKKGPFSLYGIEIDSEWRSDLKWERIRSHVGSLKDKRIADVGCHNGYFMYRMRHDDPEVVVGFEPVPKHLLAFELLQNYLAADRLVFEPLGVEHLDLYPKFFDSIFLLGILYHHTDPIGLLRKAKAALRPGGELIIDCQGLAGEEPVALVPKGRYAGASGIWFLPSKKCLENWVLRSGFSKLELFFAEPLLPSEQRATAWAEIKSLKDFLSEDLSSTIEGYPAPWRFYLRCQL